MSESFAELFEESLQTIEMAPGAIVTGVVIDIDKDWVTVHAGLKSEGVIPIDQFFDENGELATAIGDEVQVSLETVEDGFGATRLSREKARRAESWLELEAAQTADEVVSGIISGKVKGGFTVDVNGLRAFCPVLWSISDRCAKPHIWKGRCSNLKSLSLTKSVTTLSCLDALLWKQSILQSVNNCLLPLKRVFLSKVSSKTLPTTAHLSI